MSLIAMAVYDTEENKRSEMTQKTIYSLCETVDFNKHRLIISDNGSCEETQDFYRSLPGVRFGKNIPVLISNNLNLGTAEAINQAWQYRQPGENAIKIDNDVIIHQPGWVDLMDEAIARDEQIGIIGLKRKDLLQSPDSKEWRSELLLLPHEPYQKWIVVERTADIMGTCTMFSSALLDKVGYSLQPGQYGFEDNLFCHRSHLAGFYNCFLPSIEIDHIDTGGATPYQQWKEKHSGENFKEYHKMVHAMINGNMPIYYNPFEK